ncbi:MAG: response regulator transcription factor [Clostridiales bacterium]|nr:response regulator transcription factor [Clostridiales bacterium]
MYRVLIIEDDISISDLLKINLEMYGFKTINAYDGKDGLKKIESEEIDIIILDIMMPIYSGYDLLPLIQKKDIPVIVLTAKDTLDAKMKGFMLGADDYMTKPFEAVELIARINAVLKRCSKVDDGLIEFDDVILNMNTRSIHKENEIVDLTLKELELLCYLVSNKGLALSRELILERVWNYDYVGNTRTVDMHIQKLRSKLDTDRISTVYKYGYRFEK